MSNLLTPKLIDLAQKIQSLPVIKLRQLDAMLSDLANHIYDIGEYVSKSQREIKSLPLKQKEKMLAEITTLEEQCVSVSNMLYEMNYDSHYMDRVQHMLAYVIKNTKELITELKSVK